MKFLKGASFERVVAIAAALVMVAAMVSCSGSPKPSDSETSQTATDEQSTEATESGGTAAEPTGATGSAASTNKGANNTTTANKTTAGRITNQGGGKGTLPASYDTSGQVKDLKGRKIVLQQYNDIEVGPNDKHRQRINAKIKQIEKEYNCKIEIYYNKSSNEDENAVTLKTSILSGKPIVDITMTHFKTWLQLYVAGMIQELDRLKAINFYDKTKFGTPQGDMENPLNEIMIVNGKRYGIRLVNGGLHSSVQFDYMMFYRYDVLKKSGVPDSLMPDTLVQNNQWTWENFEKILKIVKDADMTGVYDAPIDTGGQSVNLYQLMCYTYGGDFIYQDPKTNKVTFNGGSQASLNALNLYKSLVSKGYVEAPTPQQYNSNPKNAAYVDTVAFMPGIVACAKWFWPRWGTNASKANWAMTYLPKIKASDSYTVVSTKFAEGFSAIPYGVSKPAEVATIMQALAPLDTDYAAQKNEFIMDYQTWLPSNSAAAASTLRILKEVNEISYTSKQKYTVTDYALGPGVFNDWLEQVHKIATNQAEAGPIIAAVTNSYNERLKNLYTIR